jgi:hypothetical protein
MSLEAPLGIDDFRQVRELGLTYVDKTHLVRELLDMPGAQVVLLPRPRRRALIQCFDAAALELLLDGIMVERRWP